MSTVTSHGYVIVYVGKRHHLADLRGYAYEHRLVAERNLGRRLRDGEEVHHRDGDTQNNDPSNIHVTANRRAHKALHRNPGSKRRAPDQDNPPITCACGCGVTFPQFNDDGRPRRFVHGHNRRQARDRNARVLELPFDAPIDPGQTEAPAVFHYLGARDR